MKVFIHMIMCMNFNYCSNKSYTKKVEIYVV